MSYVAALLLITAAAAAAAVAAPAGHADLRAGTRPNVVILFLDDWAWGDLGANGFGAETPHMDALAASGMRFTDAHAMSVCTPSRAALLTGRLGLRTGVVVNFGEDSLAGLPLTEATLADYARAAGYDTKASSAMSGMGGSRRGSQRYRICGDAASLVNDDHVVRG